MAKRIATETTTQRKTLVIGVHSPYNPTKNIEGYYEEFLNLVRSNGIEPDHKLFIKLRELDPGYYFSKGKLNDIIDFCTKEQIEQVIISEPLSTKQERNLSHVLQCAVFDRTMLILEIFENGAVSAEGKIQVEMAMLNHLKTRIAGQGKELAQQAGYIGMRGPGKTQKESDLDHIEHLMVALRKKLKQLHQVRETQRKARLGRNVPLICLIGYTNAGKSSIFNALTKSHVLAEDKLFATLDTTTRELFVNAKKKGLLSDTVGFIQQLPHQLIEAFKATLDELQYAHLLLHIIDIADPNWQAHIITVNNLLEDLGVDKPILYVFNKADKLSEEQILMLPLNKYQPHVVTSTYTEHGLDQLLAYLAEWK
jgi:GTPase